MELNEFQTVKILKRDHEEIRKISFLNRVKHYEVVGFALNALLRELKDQDANHPLFQSSEKK